MVLFCVKPFQNPVLLSVDLGSSHFFWVVNETRKTLLCGEPIMFCITIGNIPGMYFLKFSEVALTVVSWTLTTAPAET